MSGVNFKKGLSSSNISADTIYLEGENLRDLLNNTGGEIKITASHTLGDFHFSLTPYMPDGVLALNGEQVSRVTYSDLYEYVLSIHNQLVDSGKKYIVSDEEWQNISLENNGYCPYYSYGDIDNHFRLPRMSGYIRATGEIDEAGNYVAEGLPNITGNFFAGTTTKTDLTGAFSVTDTISYKQHGAGGGYTDQDISAKFDASRSNPIYGNSEHVTPETNTLFVGVWALNAFSQVGTADLDEIKEVLERSETILGDSLPLLSSRYDTIGMETSAWKLSTGQWLDGRIYTEAYNKILEKLAEGDSKILEMTPAEMASSSEFPENFLVDTEVVQFRLPLYVLNERFIIKEYQDGTSWYKLYNDGWCEQGGKTGVLPSNVNSTINLHTPMVDGNYTVVCAERFDSGTNDGNNENYWLAAAPKASYFVVYNSAGGYKQLYWNVSGYAEIPPREEWNIPLNFYFKVSHGLDESRINLEEKLIEFESDARDVLASTIEECAKDAVVYVDKQVGEMYFSLTPNYPDGVIPLDGRLLLRETYSDLWQWVQEQGIVKDDELITTNDENTVSIFNEDGTIRYCSWYGTGDGSLTFRVPKINGYFKGTGNVDEAGNYVAEGLPNITGRSGPYENCQGWNITSAGALASTRAGSTTIGGGGTGSYFYSDLDASLSNPIYGNSEHVTPETNTLFVGVWAITAAKTAVFDLNDIQEILESSESYLMNNVPLFSSRWDRDGLGNLGWVKADGLWVDGRTYVSAYNKLVERFVNGKSYVIESQVAAYNEDNYDKFIVDRIYKRFRLPVSNGQRTFEEIDGLNNDSWVLYWKIAHEFYAPAQAEIQEKLDLVDNLVSKLDISLPTLSSRWDTDIADNLGWVKSEGQWLNGNSYPDAYQMIVSRIGMNEKFVEAEDGTVLSDDNYDKFLVDTTAVKFRLPLSNGERTLVKKYQSGTEWYNVYSDGWCEQGGNFYNNADVVNTITFLIPFINSNYYINRQTGINGNYGGSANQHYYSISGLTNVSFNARTTNVTGVNEFRWTAQGYSNIQSVGDYNTGSYLYYKLGDEVPSTVVDTQQIVDDLHAECLEFKNDLDTMLSNVDFVTEWGGTDENWYRLYHSGWIEQGGYVKNDSYSTKFATQITLLKSMSGTNYNIIATATLLNNDKYGPFGLNIENQTETSFDVYFYTAANEDGIKGFYWTIKGFAQSET